jgi:hypothetical protein
MDFRRYAAFFRPEELDTLTAAFEATWQELTRLGVDLSSEEKLDSLKKKLAQRGLLLFSQKETAPGGSSLEAVSTAVTVARAGQITSAVES